MDLPRGTVTYIFTDVQGSTRLWEQAPELMTTALEMHDRVIDQAAVENGGVSVKPRGEGDSHFLVFTSASDAVNAAANIQRSWNSPGAWVFNGRFSSAFRVWATRAAAGDHEQALDAFLECLAASYEMGAVVEVAGLLTRIAVVHVEMGRHEKAIEILASVLARPSPRSEDDQRDRIDRHTGNPGNGLSRGPARLRRSRIRQNQGGQHASRRSRSLIAGSSSRRNGTERRNPNASPHRLSPSDSVRGADQTRAPTGSPQGESERVRRSCSAPSASFLTISVADSRCANVWSPASMTRAPLYLRGASGGESCGAAVEPRMQ